MTASASTIATLTGTGIAGGVAGVGATEVARRRLDPEEVDRLVRAEIDERLTLARHHDDIGRGEDAAALRHEAATLAAFL